MTTQIFYHPGTFGMMLATAYLLNKHDQPMKSTNNEHSHDEFDQLYILGDHDLVVFHGLETNGELKPVSLLPIKYDPDSVLLCPVFGENFRYLRHRYNIKKFWQAELDQANFKKIFAVKTEHAQRYSESTCFYNCVLDLLQQVDHYPAQASMLQMEFFFTDHEVFIDNVQKLFGVELREHVRQYLQQKRQANIDTFNDYKSKFCGEPPANLNNFSDFDRIIAIANSIGHDNDRLQRFKNNWTGETIISNDQISDLIS